MADSSDSSHSSGSSDSSHSSDSSDSSHSSRPSDSSLKRAFRYVTEKILILHWLLLYASPLFALTTAVIDCVLLWERPYMLILFVVFLIAGVASFFLIRRYGGQDMSFLCLHHFPAHDMALFLAAFCVLIFECATLAISRKVFFITTLIYCYIVTPLAISLYLHPMRPWKQRAKRVLNGCFHSWIPTIHLQHAFITLTFNLNVCPSIMVMMKKKAIFMWKFLCCGNHDFSSCEEKEKPNDSPHLVDRKREVPHHQWHQQSMYLGKPKDCPW